MAQVTPTKLGVYDRPGGLFRGRLEFVMHHHHVNKHGSAKAFRRASRKTKAANMRTAPMRGGIRL